MEKKKGSLIKQKVLYLKRCQGFEDNKRKRKECSSWKILSKDLKKIDKRTQKEKSHAFCINTLHTFKQHCIIYCITHVETNT